MDKIDTAPNYSHDPTHAVVESDERFHLLVDAVSEYAIYMLDPSGRIVTWNNGAQRIKGYTQSEILGQPFSLFFTPEDIEHGKPARILETAIREGKYQEEGWRVRKDGTRFWANALITALFDREGVLRGFGKVTRDMTERKLAEEQREQLREQEQQLILEREERALMESAMRMRDMFMTVLAHELRTPITSLLGNAQLLLRRGRREHSLTERDQRNVEVIISQASRLNEMVTLQLDISRLNTGQLHIDKQPVDVAALARQLVEETLPTVTQHTVEFVGPDKPLLVEGDELRLFQVLQNLVQNAIKYSPTGGTVQVRVEPCDTTAQIIVTDEGIGIPEADCSQLFQRFYRATNVDEHHISGLGVGLYVVKELVTLHGGTVEVESTEGQGSAFIISLPLLAEKALA